MSKESTCARVSFLIKLLLFFLIRYLFIKKKRLWHRCFPVNLVVLLHSLNQVEYVSTINVMVWKT